MGLNPRDLITAAWAGVGFAGKVKDIILAARRDELEGDDLWELVREVYDVMGEVSKAEEEMVLLVSISAAMVLGQVMTAIATLTLEDIVGQEQAENITTLTEFASLQQAKVQNELDRAQGIIDQTHIIEIARLIRAVHRVGMVLSPEYRDYITLQYDETARLAGEVFGDASYLNSAVVLLQGTIYDITALSGEPVSVAETRLFKTMTEVTDRVASQSRNYARNPGSFWYDLNNYWFSPLAGEREGILRRQGGRLDNAITLLNSTSGLATSVARGLDNFRVRAAPFLDEDQRGWLRRFRDDFKQDISDPLREIGRIIDEEIPAFEVAIEVANAELASQEVKIQELGKLTANPNDVPEADRQRIAQRHNEWIDNALAVAVPSNEVFAAAVRRYDEILAEVQGAN